MARYIGSITELIEASIPGVIALRHPDRDEIIIQFCPEGKPSQSNKEMVCSYCQTSSFDDRNICSNCGAKK